MIVSISSCIHLMSQLESLLPAYDTWCFTQLPMVGLPCPAAEMKSIKGKWPNALGMYETLEDDGWVGPQGYDLDYTGILKNKPMDDHLFAWDLLITPSKNCLY